ncbi:MAG: hypothetical protein H8D63_03370 [Parcubacteria group bacterium]|nr:hypothetical protein [Parcubacteria group bacterium]
MGHISRIVFFQNTQPYNGRIFGHELQEALSKKGLQRVIVETRSILTGIIDHIRKVGNVEAVVFHCTFQHERGVRASESIQEIIEYGMPFFFVTGFGSDKKVSNKKDILKKELRVMNSFDFDQFSVTLQELPEKIEEVLKEAGVT